MSRSAGLGFRVNSPSVLSARLVPHDATVNVEARSKLILEKALSALATPIRVLDLSCHCATDDLMTRLSGALAASSLLEVLYLNENKLTDASALALVPVLTSNPRIKYLSLERNEITSTGAIAIVTALKQNHRLTHINFAYNHRVDNRCIPSLVELLSHSTTLEGLALSETSVNGAGVHQLAPAIVRSASLRELLLTGLDLMDAADALAAIVRSSSLARLNIMRAQLQDAGAVPIFDALAQNSRLKTLRYSQNSLYAEGCAAVARMLRSNRTLTYLTLASCDMRADWAEDVIRALASNTTLQVLFVQGNRWGSPTISQLFQSLASTDTLRKLVLTYCSVPVEPCIASTIRYVRDSRNLHSLSINFRPMFREAHSSQVHTLMSQLMDVLAFNPSLAKLKLYRCELPAEAVQRLCQSLSSNRNLVSLTINSIEHWPQCAPALIGALHGNFTLRKFVLRVDGGHAIIDGLVAGNKHLFEQALLHRRRTIWAGLRQFLPLDVIETHIVPLLRAAEKGIAWRELDMGRAARHMRLLPAWVDWQPQFAPPPVQPAVAAAGTARRAPCGCWPFSTWARRRRQQEEGEVDPRLQWMQV